MIVIDTSAVVAIMAREAEAETFAIRIGATRSKYMSAGNYLESAMIADRRFSGRQDLDLWFRDQAVDIVSVDRGQAEVAADAFARYGKGRHPASLNYGDCFAYALARTLRAPLLFKGRDFALTDVLRASV